MNLIKNQDERASLLADLFIFAQEADLKESILFLAQVNGLELGDNFSNDINVDRLSLILELAKEFKKNNENMDEPGQIYARLREENARLEAIAGSKPAGQAKIARQGSGTLHKDGSRGNSSDFFSPTKPTTTEREHRQSKAPSRSPQ